VYSQGKKELYLQALLREIDNTDMSGEARWLYFGGGTPNTLPVDDLVRIRNAIAGKVRIQAAGIELLPAFVTPRHLRELKKGGFTKISLGVESFQREVIQDTGRTVMPPDGVGQIVDYARSIGLWVNVDLMVGLPAQNDHSFMADIEKIAAISPDQVTIYPFMVIRGCTTEPGMTSSEQFNLIEDAFQLLDRNGYQRMSIWITARGKEIYDSSRDELVDNYIGFGPAAFSTSDELKIVNPELEPYIAGILDGQKRGFVASKNQATDDWRSFARMVYDLRCTTRDDLPGYINTYIKLLRLARYAGNGSLTRKGNRFAHTITKMVVESLPFPIQNRACVQNWEEYSSYRRAVREQS
jgi:oxygen-independent coproporphyrinogen-3 oxidase